MSRRNLKTVLAVMEVRGVQRRAAEMQVLKADAELRQLDDRRHRSVEKLKGEMEAWSRSVTGRSVGLEIAAAWSRTILQGEAELDRTDLQIDQAKAERTRLGHEWAAASARSDAARTMGERALRRARRQREEQDLSNFADQFAQRRRAP